MKILITGATGTIGANAVKYFTEHGYSVRAQVRPNSWQLHKIEPFKPEIAMVRILAVEILTDFLTSRNGMLRFLA